MLAEDRGWANRIIEAIETGLTAEAAVQKVQNDMRARMRDIQDPYLRERLSDLDDLNNRLLRHLLGIQETASGARSAGERHPGRAQYGAGGTAGLRPHAAEGRGAGRGHGELACRHRRPRARYSAARALRRPDGRRCRRGDPLVLDGENEQVFMRPSEDILQTFADRHARAAGAPGRPMPPSAICPRVTLDGIDVTLMMNAGLLIDVPQSGGDRRRRHRALSHRGHLHGGAFLSRCGAPARCLCAACSTARDGKPVVFRTLDIGSRQGAALLAARRRRESGDGLAGAPHLARSAGDAAPAIARDDPARRAGRRAPRDVPDGGAGRRVRRRARQILDLELQRAEEHGRQLPSA